MIGKEPICETCIHRDWTKPGTFCSAFPEGIPPAILNGDDDHSEPWELQHGSDVYEPIDDGSNDN